MGPALGNNRPQLPSSNQETGPVTDTAREPSLLSSAVIGTTTGGMRKAALIALMGLASTAMVPRDGAGQEAPPSAPTTPAAPKETLTKSQMEVKATFGVLGTFLKANGASIPEIKVGTKEQLTKTLSDFTQALRSVPEDITGKDSILGRIRTFGDALKDLPSSPVGATDRASAEFSKSVGKWKNALVTIGNWNEQAGAQKNDKDGGKNEPAAPKGAVDTIIIANLLRLGDLLEKRNIAAPDILVETPRGTQDTLNKFWSSVDSLNAADPIKRHLLNAIDVLQKELEKKRDPEAAARAFDSRIKQVLKEALKD